MPLLVFVPSRDTLLSFTKQSCPIRNHIHLSSFEKRNDTFFSKRFKQNSCSRIKYYFFDGKKRSRVANRFISLLLLFERNEQTMAGTDKGSRGEGEEEGEGERRRSKLGESDIFERSRTVSRRRRRRGREREREGGFAFLPAYVPHEDFFHPLTGFCHRFHDKERGEPLEEIHKDGIVALFVPWPVTRTVPDAFIACHPPAETARKKKERRKKEKEKERGVA